MITTRNKTGHVLTAACVVVFFYHSLVRADVVSGIVKKADVSIVVDFTKPKLDSPVIKRNIIGFNLAPGGHSYKMVKCYGVTGKNTNGAWELLRKLNPGLLRVWTSSIECSLDMLQLPKYNPKTDGSWKMWAEKNLAVGSPYWKGFDAYIKLLSELGDDVKVMLCIPAFPPWLGPFRMPIDRVDLLDLRTGSRTKYNKFIEYSGINGRTIGDYKRFTVFQKRVSIYIRLLAEHCLADPVLKKTIRYIEVGNEPDNPLKKSGPHKKKQQVSRYWRMWVYGSAWRDKLKNNQKLSILPPEKEGLLQEIYDAVYTGLRIADPNKHIEIGGVGSAWAHTQKNMYYFRYFIDGMSTAYKRKGQKVKIKGVGRNRIDFISYHSYGDKGKSHTPIIKALYTKFGKKIFLTEYNASSGGHGMNFMQSGATSVANTIIQLCKQPYIGGATFFKGSGGGFGLILQRGAKDGIPNRTGPYWTMLLVSKLLVDGQPVAVDISKTKNNAIDCMAVVKKNKRERSIIIVNKSDRTYLLNISFSQSKQIDMNACFIELPIAKKRDDYRNVSKKDLRFKKIKFPLKHPIEIKPRGVIFLNNKTRSIENEL